MSVTLVAPLLLAGCSQPPADTIDAASAALQSAQEAGAAEYAAESMSVAEGAKAAMEAEIATQNEKFSLFRSYAKTAELAAAAQAAAEKAAEDAEAGKEAIRTEATALMEGVRTSLVSVQEMLDKAPRGKGTRAEIDSMRADLAAVESGFADFDAAMGEGLYLDALGKAQAAQAAIDQVKTEIEGAIEARNQARR